MEEVIGRQLIESGRTLAVAESCTAGMLGMHITRVPGSSSYFKGGIICYSNEAKMALCGVPAELLETHGAVSAETAEALAQGVRKSLNSTIGLAITGIAGPGGGSREKPVGTVHIGLSTNQADDSLKYRFWITREQIKLHTAMMAMDWVRRYLNGDPFLPGL